MPHPTYRGIPVKSHLQNHDKVAQVLGDLIGSGAVLDLPAGPGAMSRRLADAGYTVQAADIAPGDFIPSDIPCVRADLNSTLPFDDGAFDAAVCVEGLEHLENVHHAVRELYRVLKPGGWLVVSTPNVTSASSRLRFLLTGFFSVAERPVNEVHTSPGEGHIAVLTYPLLRFALRQAGFEVRWVTGSVRRNGGAWFYALWPWARMMTAKAMFTEEPDPRQREINRRVAREILSADLLLSRILIVAARKPDS